MHAWVYACEHVLNMYVCLYVHTYACMFFMNIYIYTYTVTAFLICMNVYWMILGFRLPFDD